MVVFKRCLQIFLTLLLSQDNWPSLAERLTWVTCLPWMFLVNATKALLYGFWRQVESCLLHNFLPPPLSRPSSSPSPRSSLYHVTCGTEPLCYEEATLSVTGEVPHRYNRAALIEVSANSQPQLHPAPQEWGHPHMSPAPRLPAAHADSRWGETSCIL